MYARPATEFRASEISNLIGRRLKAAVPAGTQLKRVHLADTSERVA
jgi:hypothetical protein